MIAAWHEEYPMASPSRTVAQVEKKLPALHTIPAID
eukprot:CAMPEP_0182579228 /NCGR_PEP_ID=MMETSP1324-20130603/43636_1 /TAXON_ID=236786 /ORGANISM="Florenciella sp., Strain RCC1587" /LENGTH=35 /DNA_ID= /DNA_START= /DNA_END= /DNA_ORIENTATION=